MQIHKDKELEKAVEKIKSVKVQGAKEIAIFALKFLKKYAMKHGFGLRFEVASYVLEQTRPTAVVLHNCLEIVKKEQKMNVFDKLIKQLETATRRLAKKGAKLIPDNATIMTHCHSGEAVATIKEAAKKKEIKVIATLTEPLMQGVKTARELKRAGIDVHLIADSATGFFMRHVDLVVVGADALRVREPRGLVNKIGTFNIALAANYYKKPFYVTANSFKIDKRKKIIIEERPKEGLINIKGIKAYNPAFDITPWKFVTKIINEKEIINPGELVKKYGKD